MARKRKDEEESVDELLEELEDVEEEEEESEDSIEEEPDAKPTKSKRSKAKKASKPKKERSGVGTTEVADEAGIDPRKLRMLLRAEFDKPEDGWRWPSMSHPQVKAILKRVKAGGAQEAQQKQLDKVKGKKKSSKSSSKKKSTKSKSKKSKK